MVGGRGLVLRRPPTVTTSCSRCVARDGRSSVRRDAGRGDRVRGPRSRARDALQNVVTGELDATAGRVIALRELR